MRTLVIPVVVASLQLFILLRDHCGVAKIWEEFPLDDDHDDRISTGGDAEWFEFDDVTFDFESTETKIRLADYYFEFKLPELNFIDRDQIEIKDHVDGATEESLETIRKIYERGGHSKPMATLRLAAPLEAPLERFSRVKGTTTEGLPVRGTLPDDAPVGATVLAFVYDRDEDRHESPASVSPETKPPCSVGGLPDPNLEGCLAASGTLEITRNDVLYYVPVAERNTTTTLAYEYDPGTENTNLQTLQGFSTQAYEKYWNCTNCPHSVFRTYLDYYGFPDYADRWIQAFLADESTNLLRGNRMPDRSEYRGSATPVARSEAVAAATVAMSTWMAVIGQLQEALVRCGDCPDGLCHQQQDHRAVRELEKAAALYTGSTEGRRSLYQLADEGSFIFNTRNDTNLEILGRMQLTSEDLSRGLCRSARERVAEIEKYMIVLLLQGVVRNAYILSTPRPGKTVYELTYDISCYWRTTPEMVWGQAEAFAAAVLPLVYQCDTDKALRLYFEMFDSNSPDWEMVKYIVVGVSECLDIQPDELGGLGGLWKRDDSGVYHEGANKPIREEYFDGTDPVLSEPKKSPNGTILTVAIAVFAVVAVGCFFVQLKNKLSPPKKQEEKEQSKKNLMYTDEKDDEELQKKY